MPSTVAEILRAIDVAIHPGKRASWDPNGLQVGDPAAPVETIGVCHEVTEAVVEGVAGSPVDLLVTYHPLLFRETRRFAAGRDAPGRAYRLAVAGIAVATAHTAFDAAPGGAADALAACFDLSDVRGFGVIEPPDAVKIVTFVPESAVESVAAAMAEAGAGVIGNYTGCGFRGRGTGTFLPGEGAAPVVGAVGSFESTPEIRLEMVMPASARDGVVSALVASHPYEEPAFDVYETLSNAGFVGRVGDTAPGTVLGDIAERAAQELSSMGLRVSGDPGAEIGRLAVVPGSGSSLVAAAGAVGADAILTGDVDHHRAVAALDSGICVVDPGHAATERPGMRALVDLVREVGPPTVDLTALDPTPWR